MIETRLSHSAPRVAVLFDNLGPYHRARLRAASDVLDILCIEASGRSGEYAWEPSSDAEAFPIQTLFPALDLAVASARDIRSRISSALATFQPCAVALPGWSDRVSFAAFDWCIRSRVPTILMSESNSHDSRRYYPVEMIKRHWVQLFGAALVSGHLQADYISQLGMPRDRIFLGYGAVDNAYFTDHCNRLRQQAESMSSARPVLEKVDDPSPSLRESTQFFLASARFITKKNLPALLRAYARYRELALENAVSQLKTWNLVLLGDGAQRDSLRTILSHLDLERFVTLPGFVQYPDLPRYYAAASAFIHASTTEQWGLVVNEAMASGLPVLVSNRCGCAPDLVQEGRNGWTFDHHNIEQLAQLMLRISLLSHEHLTGMGLASRQIIADWGPKRFAVGIAQAAACAVQVGPKRATYIDHLFLSLAAKR